MIIKLYKKILTALIVVSVGLVFASTVYAQLEVVTVPWVPGNSAIPHDTYNGVSTTFMAIARGGNGSFTYEWDFNGDGTYDFSATTTNPYDLSANHLYPFQASDRLFIARVRVTSGTEVVTAEYRVMIHEPATLDVKINRTIDNALWFLHSRMNRFSPGGVDMGDYASQTLGAAGMAAQAWAIQGHKVNGNFNTNPYVEDIRRTLNYCLSRTYTISISNQSAGDPDGNGNGIGLYSSLQSQMYETGIVLMALANSAEIQRLQRISVCRIQMWGEGHIKISFKIWSIFLHMDKMKTTFGGAVGAMVPIIPAQICP